jgi:hypothetical protein
MNRRLLMCLLALVLVLPLSGVLYAQDLSETFTASGLTLSYPADWFAQDSEDAIVVANVEVDLSTDAEDLPANGIAVSVAPPDMMTGMVEEGSTALDALNLFLGFMDVDNEPEEITLGSYSAARVDVGNSFIPNADVNATIYVIDVEGAFLFSAVIYGIEYSSEPEIAQEILATLVVDPSAIEEASSGGLSGSSEPLELADPSVPLVYGDSVGGELTNREDDQVWTFSGSEGDVVTITMISTADDFALDPRLYLYTLEGFDGGDDAIAENDDASNPEVSGFNSQIEAFELPGDGEYVIVATRFGDGTGTYTLSIEEGGETRAERAAAATPIAYGDEVTGEISDDAPTVLYTFEGTTGDVITITMVADGDDFDPSLALYTLEGFTDNGFATMTNDDALTEDLGFNSQIAEFELFEDGTYIIEATRFSGEGEYTLTLESGK